MYHLCCNSFGKVYQSWEYSLGKVYCPKMIGKEYGCIFCIARIFRSI